MKHLQKTNSILCGLALSLAFLACVPRAEAQNAYFDVNGPSTTPTAYGTANGGVYSWDTTNWGVSGGAGTTVAWTPGTFARFYGTSNYTVTVNAAESMAGLFDGSGTANIVTIQDAGNGTGSLSVVTNSTLTVSQNGFKWYGQGWFTDGSTVAILCPITGPGSVETEQSGTIQLYATNTFSGGYISESSSTFIDFNNNFSFGTGQFLFDNTTGYSILNNTGPTTVNITNAVQTFETTTVNFIGNSCTFGSSWYLGGSTYTIGLRNNGVASSVVTLGPMSATGGAVTFSSANGASFLLNGVNTYTGETVVGYPVASGDANVILEIGASGSLASTVISNSSFGGILKLDGANCLNTNASLELPPAPSNNIINLNFTGTQSIAGIYLGGVLQTGGTYGSTSSSATYPVSWITGTGILSTPAAPSIVTQPESLAVFVGGYTTFNVTAAGASPLTYQWYQNGTNIPNANGSSYVISPASTNSLTNYYVVITNSAGSITSSVVTLYLVPTNGYTQTIVGDSPIGYWLLDETNGTTAYDVIGGNNGFYKNVNLGQPGYSLTDPATSIGLPGSGSLPPYGSTNGFVVVSNYSPFTTFTGGNASFTLEAWVKFTNFSGTMRLFSDLQLSSPNGFAFGIASATSLKMTQGAVQDATVTLTNALNEGVWYLLDLVNDGSFYYFYVDGNPVGAPVAASNGDGVGAPLQFGCNPTNYFGANESLSEQVQGYMDQVAIYASGLNATQISNHFAARYSTLEPPVVTAPIATPPTNYVSLSTTLQSEAAGILLAYQWYQSPSNLLMGQTNATLTLSPLVLSNGGSYFVQVTNPAGSSNSPSVAITVLPIPTNSLQLNLTNSLVLHLPFDSNYNDTSGLGNNGTNVGSTTIVPGVVGAGALSYSSTAGGPYNYVTLGAVPALQFGATTNFSVSFWVQEPQGSSYTNLPFFGDATNSTSGIDGFAFAPYTTAASGGGGWQWLVADGTHDATSPSQYTSFNDLNIINDGNWHNLVFVAQRSGNVSTYVDGVEVDQEAISFVGNISNTNAAIIGQDPTGAYSVTGQAYLDDLGVWSRTLSQLEVSGIYLAGISNSVSFAPSSAPIVPVKLSIVEASGQIQISWSGSGATLQATTNATGTFTNVTGATSPYTVPTPVGKQMFYRLQY